jgi:hypothetical protein
MLLTLLKKISKLNFKNFAIIQLASLIPFGTFYVEKNTARMFKFIEKYLVIFIQY